MIHFTTALLKFDAQGEKTGWTYIEIPKDMAEQLKPDNKKSFRVKGSIDNYSIKGVALIPTGNGNFIMAVNATMRKSTGKRKGALVNIELSIDEDELKLNSELIDCLHDEPAAFNFFNTLPKGHQRYFSKWIEDAKTEQTKTKRLLMAVSALSRKLGYSEMIREDKARRNFN